MDKSQSHYDVVIIGAGPAGALAASLLTQGQRKVLVVEKQHFPRFSIGESLLPQSMVYLQQANLLDAIKQAAPELGFQFKNGAAFFADQHYCYFDFEQKFSEGPCDTFQVKRAQFDHLLVQLVQDQGAEFRFGHSVTEAMFNDKCQLTVENEQGEVEQISAEFVLDASGFVKVLPRLLNLTQPSDFPVRSSIFCHIKDGISCQQYDRNKILIETHPLHRDVWYWLIPFSDGTASLGCVAKPDFFEALGHNHGNHEQALEACIEQTVRFKELLEGAEKASPVQHITGYSSNVKQLYGERFALLGNAGEFLDPIFSSGVTIAFKSAKLAADALLKQFSGQTVCWESEFALPLQQGVDTFKAFVQSWYDGQLQDIIHYESAPENIREMVCSILAGYAWDTTNPFVQQTERRLNTLGQLCAAS